MAKQRKPQRPNDATVEELLPASFFQPCEGKILYFEVYPDVDTDMLLLPSASNMVEPFCCS